MRMLILLPERRNGLSDMESELTNDILSEIPLNLREVPVQVTLPRFIVHKCAVQVNEEGGEAAAVTGVSAGVRTGGPLVPLFTADHPFLFLFKIES
ncbi:serpin B8 [Caerostris extrusa]|uniref:Serpin B8 n=1 Tax=Caerostris extrusa TaxID=172846 RepID=A0AAV4PGQ3_CAEEX|nr:serpin B8 [Caerostris extrusa]